MAKFCRYCGKPVWEDAKFCTNCGKPIAEAATQPKAQSVAEAKAQPKAQPVAEAAAQPKAQQPARSAPRRAKASSDGAQRNGRKTAPSSARQASAVMPQDRQAAASAGEIDLGEIVFPGAAAAAGRVSSPLGGIFRCVGSYLGGILRIFRKPAALIGTLLLAALWFVLAQLRGSDSEIVRILSWLTCAEGGYGRGAMNTVSGALGTLGGVLGKGTAAAALISLLPGGLIRAVKGLGALFAGHVERRSLLSILLGAVIGAALYFAFTGKYTPADAAMAGIAGALLSLEALGGGKGKLYELAQSLTSRAKDGIRSAMRGRCDGLLTGLTLGFALATVLAASGVLEGLL